MAAEEVIKSLVVPPYPETSDSTTSGVLTTVPVASVEKGVNAKSFVAYKSHSGLSRRHPSTLCTHFGFRSYD